MTLVRSLDHINIRTAELDSTRSFFVDVLGLTEGWRPPFPFPGAWLYAGDSAVVHLVQVGKAAMASEGSALDHFAFEISDYEEALARVRAAGLSFVETDVPGSTIRQIFVRDGNGVSIELNWKGASPHG